MKKLFYISIILSFVSCQIEDKNAPQPSESFIKYFGELADQEAADLEPIWNADSSDVDGYVLFGTQEIEGQSKDYYVAISDANGHLVRSKSFGFRLPVDGLDITGDGVPDSVFADESASRIHAVPNGYVVVGTSTISSIVGQTTNGGNRSVEILDLSLATIAFFDGELNLLGDRVFPVFGDVNIFNDQQLDLFGHDIIPLADGGFLLIGAKETDTDLDFYARRFSISGTSITTVWERTYGFKNGGLDDVFVKGFEKSNNNLALFGYSEDLGAEGEEGVNVTFIELNQNGNIVRSNSNGIEDSSPFLAEDILEDVVEKAGGYLAVGTSTTNDSKSAFFMDINAQGIAVSKGVLQSDFQLNEEGLQTMGTAAAQTQSKDFIIVGNYPSFRTDTETRAGEALFARLDQSGVKKTGFETNYGLGDGNDSAEGIVLLPSGKMVVIATVDFGGGVKMISLIKLNDTGQLDR